MIEVKEIVRLWLDGRSQREVSELTMADPKTVPRYVETARACGLDRDGDLAQLTDELLAAVVSGARPQRPHGRGASWQALAGQQEQLEEWIDKGLTLTKIHTMLGRRGIVVSYRTLHRYAINQLGFGRRRTTVRVIDGEPGSEIQVDLGRLGLIPDPATGTKRALHGLIFTAVYSRYMFVYPTQRQTLDEVIAGFDAAWAFFEGVFAVVIPDNMKAIVDRADAIEPRINDAFREYAQARGFVIDPTRVRKPCDKLRVEDVFPTCARTSLLERTFGILTTAGHGRRRGAG